MSETLARIYAIQQREINQIKRHQQQQIAKRQRLIAAFNASGLVSLFNEFRNIPLRPEVRQRVYKNTVSELTYQSSTPVDKLSDMSFVSVSGCSNGPRWWCEETDTGRIRYCYTSGTTGSTTETFDTPQGLWFDTFVEYLARATDPTAIAERLSAAPAAQQPRRQLQPI